jgi:hypothetical protein
MKISLISAIVALTLTVVSGQSESNSNSVNYRAYNYDEPFADDSDTVQQNVINSHARQDNLVDAHSSGHNKTDNKHVRKRVARGAAVKAGRCSTTRSPTLMPQSYNDKSSGFFVDMGLILTDYYGLTTKMSKLQMNSIARTFTAPISSYAKAQGHQSNEVLYNSLTGLLNILIEHTVNDTFISSSEWGRYNIHHRVFSPVQVNDLLRKRSRLLKYAQDRDNGSDEVIRKEVAVRKMQLKIIQAKGQDGINTIIADGVNYRQYRNRFSEYMWNICAHTKDRDTIRQVRNHFAFWLSKGSEDQESKEELDTTYEEGSSSSFFYPEGLKLSVATGIYTLLGAVIIGLFMSV